MSKTKEMALANLELDLQMDYEVSTWNEKPQGLNWMKK